MIKISLTSLSEKFFPQLSQSLLIFLGFSCLSITHCAISVAQTSPLMISELPPPSSMTQMDEVSSSDEGEPITTIPYFESTPATPDQPTQQEYNFQAPQPDYSSIPSNYPPNSVDKLVEFYRVEVMVEEVKGEDKSLLSQVKQIEPFAYIQTNNGVIYAGLFQDQREAQQRVQQLTNQGLSSRIVPVNYSVSSSYDLRVEQ